MLRLPHHQVHKDQATGLNVHMPPSSEGYGHKYSASHPTYT